MRSDAVLFLPALVTYLDYLVVDFRTFHRKRGVQMYPE